MFLLEQRAPQLFLLRIPHPHFVPVICCATARRVRLPHGLHLRVNLFSQPLQVRERQHSFHLDVIDLFQAGPILQHVCRQVAVVRSEEHTSELQSQSNLVCRLLLEKKKSGKDTGSTRSGSSRTTSRPSTLNSITR